VDDVIRQHPGPGDRGEVDQGIASRDRLHERLEVRRVDLLVSRCRDLKDSGAPVDRDDRVPLR